MSFTENQTLCFISVWIRSKWIWGCIGIAPDILILSAARHLVNYYTDWKAGLNFRCSGGRELAQTSSRIFSLWLTLKNAFSRVLSVFDSQMIRLVGALAFHLGKFTKRRGIKLCALQNSAAGHFRWNIEGILPQSFLCYLPGISQ